MSFTDCLDERQKLIMVRMMYLLVDHTHVFPEMAEMGIDPASELWTRLASKIALAATTLQDPDIELTVHNFTCGSTQLQ